jgi:hypothetical protein
MRPFGSCKSSLSLVPIQFAAGSLEFSLSAFRLRFPDAN